MRSTPIITGLLLVAPPVSVLGFAALLLWLSGDWRWVEGLGASLVFVGGALLLGSISGLLLGLAMVVLIVVRIFGEEKLLARDLEGYKEYLQKVRYRLVPHVW
jgi:protein-S-isoprenylcysteine O-methyltransferase Ste14